MKLEARPFPFSGAEVLALLRGTKSQVRCLAKPARDDAGFVLVRQDDGSWKPKHVLPLRSPYLIGDQLWVREAWKYQDWTTEGDPWIRYEADGAVLKRYVPESYSEQVTDVWAELSKPENLDTEGRAVDPGWRSRDQMPRWASRFTLEIRDVRVERLTEISNLDVVAEGFALPAGFRSSWESVRGAGSWEQNPWVWVLTFRRVE